MNKAKGVDKESHIAARIKSAGTPAAKRGNSKEPAREVFCQICGGAIRSDDASGAEYVKDKRGCERFYCRRCMGK